MQTFGLVALVAAVACGAKAFLAPQAPGLPAACAAGPAGAGLRLAVRLLAPLAVLIVAFPRYPARGFRAETLPLLLAALLCLPGLGGGVTATAGPVAALALVVAWRRGGLVAGWRNLAADVHAALPAPGWRAAVLAGGGVLLVYLLAAQFAEMDKVAGHVTDFGTFYRASTTLMGGGDPYRDLEGFLYPPSFAFWFRPLTWLTPVEASLAWFVAKLALVAWTFQLAAGYLDRGGLAGRRRGWFLFGVVLVAGRFWLMDLQFGNTNAVVLFLTVGALVWCGDRPARAGFSLALAATIKVVPALLAGYLLLTRRWRALAWATAWVAVLNLVPLAAAPARMVPAWGSYRAVQAGTAVAQRRDQPDNQSLWGALARELPADLPALRLAWALGVLGLVGGTAWATRRAQVRGAAAQRLAAAMWPLLVLLVSPGSWVVHYTAVLLPLAAWLHHLLTASGRRPGQWLLFVVLNLVLTLSGWWRWSIRLAADRSLFVATALVILLVLGLLAAGPGRDRPLPEDATA